MKQTKANDILISVAEFNKEVKDWTNSVRRKAYSRLSDATTGEYSGQLKRSFKSSLKFRNGEAESTGFKFNYYGVFIHYGVGRGYVHLNGVVVRGRSLSKQEKGHYLIRGDKKKDISKMKVAFDPSGRPITRYGFDWIDIEIRNNIEKMADIAQEYHGDKAAREVLKQANKLLIQKP